MIRRSRGAALRSRRRPATPPRSSVRRAPALFPLAGLLLLGACAPALHAPPPFSPAAPGSSTGDGAARNAPAGTDELLREAEASFARRPDREAVARAEVLFRTAAAADPRSIAGFVGVVRATSWRIEHEADAGARQRALAAELDAAQWCGQRAPGNAACDYWLAIALGQQARERPATALDGLKKMAAALRRAAAAQPALEEAGPDRVLALLLLRAPGWPAGPGDPEEALAAARRAAKLRPEYAPNQLVLGEAALANGLAADARAAYAAALAAARAAGDPDAAGWASEAATALARIPD